MNIRRKILIAIGIILLAAILAPLIHHFQLRWALNNYVVALKAKGEPMELEQVLPPPVPAAQNAALLVMKASALFATNSDVLETNGPPAMEMMARGKAMMGWRQTVVRTRYGTNSWADVEAALLLNTPALKLLSEITNQTQLDFNLNYKDGVAKLKSPFLAAPKRAVQLLSSEVMNDLHQGDTASAVQNVSTMLRLTGGFSHERLAISELIRIAMEQITLKTTWELLQTTNISDAQLAAMQDGWDRQEFLHAYQNALEMERVIAQISTARWRKSEPELQQFLTISERAASFGLDDTDHTRGEEWNVRAKDFLWRYWWSYADELRSLKGQEIILDTARVAETNGSLLVASQRQEKQLPEIVPVTDKDILSQVFEEHDMRTLLSSSLGISGSIFNKIMIAETTRRMAITAIAVKRYQLKYGHYPADLNSLAPEFVRAIPLDPVDGYPLRYRLGKDGEYTLYSVGENGVDDGGNPAVPANVKGTIFYWLNYAALDWVWPQPASETEIENYFQHINSKNN